jgi:penicillin-binding protein 1A
VSKARLRRWQAGLGQCTILPRLFRRRRDEAAPNRRRRRIRKLRLLALLAVLGLLGIAAFTFGLVRAVAGELPKLDPAYQQKLERNSYIYDSTGKRILAIVRGSQNRVLVAGDEIDPKMKLAIVAIEDRRFYEHRGIDLRGILRAAWADIRHKSVVEGGSTITQQFVKNYAVTDEDSVARKVKEAALAWQVEQRWKKDRILTAYLNTIYFGNGAYGIEQAARTYFHHSASSMTLAEAALLAGIPRDPSDYDPVVNPDGARARRTVVLREMLEQRMITRREYRRAARAPLPAARDVRLPGSQGPAPYFVNYVKQLLIDRYGAQRVLGGGLRVQTSIDLRLQEAARDAISKWLTRENGPAAALVALDTRSGRVLALVGGNNFHESQFNLAVQGERQPGSAFKPFVLATALQLGISPETTFVSRPVSIPLGDRVWYVHNYEGAYLGSINLQSATTYSDNSVYAQLTSLLDPSAVARTAKRLGIHSRLRNYFSIGLGAQAVNPLEMARAFSAFANGGMRVDGSLLGDQPRAVLSVVKDGKWRPNAVEYKRVLTPRTATLVTSMLQGVVREGTGRRAQLPDSRVVAGKTGTTENYGDAWFVGYTPQIVAAVWVGYPDTLRPMLHEFNGDPVAGGTYPALIWKAFMKRALKLLHLEPAYFSPAPAVFNVGRRVVTRNGSLMLDNGYCRGAREVLFMDGAPGLAKTANCKPNEVYVPRVVGEPLSRARELLAAQPLKAAPVYRWAEPKERVGVVLRQFPAHGTLSSHDEVRLVLARAPHGVVPDVVGRRLTAARAALRRQKLLPRVVRLERGPRWRVLFQAPKAGVAAAPGMLVKLIVSR